uniref:Uncharacterized protein n=1 Tax=Romanomermis culicivorax TaxID=13658 RepID=A0A915KJT1_ROMCU
MIIVVILDVQTSNLNSFQSQLGNKIESLHGKVVCVDNVFKFVEIELPAEQARVRGIYLDQCGLKML